eukprot:m.948469 g.948469  ORF g.948469 m.948469 type:complete len:82 (-) comp23850_c0_seq41:144-389(-)
MSHLSGRRCNRFATKCRAFYNKTSTPTTRGTSATSAETGSAASDSTEQVPGVECTNEIDSEVVNGMEVLRDKLLYTVNLRY